MEGVEEEEEEADTYSDAVETLLAVAPVVPVTRVVGVAEVL